MSVFLINAFGFAVAAFFWSRNGWGNALLGIMMACLAVLNAALTGAAMIQFGWWVL